MQVKTYDRGYSQTHPQAQILGVGYDRNLGGIDLQIVLRDFLAKKFNEMGKTKTDVTTVPRYGSQCESKELSQLLSM